MTPSAKCVDLVKRFEGCVLKAYPDPKTGGDPWTIGFGHTGAEIKRGLVWTREQADAALASDLAAFAKGVAAAVPIATQGQFDALVSFGFNVGLGRKPGRPGKIGLLDSTLLRKHNAGDYTGAAIEFGKWISKGTPVEKGLARRRAAEVVLYQGKAG